MNSINDKIITILGYVIYVIHLLLSIVMNIGWLFVTNTLYLHILIFSQSLTLLGWCVFKDKCIITLCENILLNRTVDNNIIDSSSITTTFLSRYLPSNLVDTILLLFVMMALLLTLVKKIYVKSQTLYE
jgi:hypothetical protein